MKIIAFDTLPSTNFYCQQNIDKICHGDIVLASTQSAGRGRRDRCWSSKEGGLYFSLVLKEGLSSIKSPGVLTQIMALSVYKTAHNLGVKAYIKWPNDILAGGKKFCGVLSEAIFDEAKIKAIIIGVGINVKGVVDSDKPAITLDELGIKVDEQVLLKDVLDNFSFYLSVLKCDGFGIIRAEYKEAFAYLGQLVTLQIFDRNITGIAADIDNDGRLILDTLKGPELIEIGDMDF